ncbi:extracellular solute-binding protein [bacterium]|nr:extracellular solute-binding protein [bacterium]
MPVNRSRLSGLRFLLLLFLCFLILFPACRKQDAGKMVIEVWDFPRPGPQGVATYAKDHWENQLLEEFQRMHPQVEIRFTRLSWTKGEQKLDISVMGNTPPDVAGSAMKFAYVERGLLEPIDTYLTPQDREDYYPGILEAFTYKGHIWAWPWYATVYTMVLNKDIFAERGVELPADGIWTWDEFVEKMQRLTFDRDGDGKIDVYGVGFNVMPGNNEAWAIIYGEGGRPLSSDGTSFTFDSPQALEGIQKLIDLEHKYHVALPNTGGLTQDNTWTLFSSPPGRTAVTCQGTWAISNLVKTNKTRAENNAKYLAQGKADMVRPLMNFAVACFPIGSSGQLLTASPGVGNWVVFRQEDPQKRRLCMELARFLTNGQNQQYCRYMGTFPSRRSTGDLYADDPERGQYMRVVQQALPDMVIRPFHPLWQKIDERIARQLQLTMLDRKTVQEAMATAGQEVEELLARSQSGDLGTASRRLWAYILGVIVAALIAIAVFMPQLRRRFLSAVRKHIWAYTFLIPDFAVFSIFIAIPVILAVIIAFKHFDPLAGIMGSPWVFLDNFKTTFTDRVFWISMRNTFIYTLIMVPWGILVALFLASLIYPLSMKAQTFFRAAYYLPGVASAVVLAMVWKWIFDPTWGLFNYLFAQVGLGPFPWLSSPDTALPSIMLSGMLAAPGGGVILYLAAMGRVPKVLHESAKIDGASAIQRWWHITLPLLKPVTLYLCVVGTIVGFQIFAKIFIMTNGGPGYATNVLVLSIYNRAFRDLEFGVAASQALVLFAIVACFAIIQFKYLSTDVEY